MSGTRQDIDTSTSSTTLIPENILIPSGIPSPKVAVEASSFTSKQPSPSLRQRSSSRASNGSPFPASPGGTAKSIPMNGTQGFIFSLHQSRRNPRFATFIKSVESTYPTIDLNSKEFMAQFIMTDAGADYFSYLRKHTFLKSLDEHEPMPSFATTLKNANLESETNIVDQIVKAIQELLKEGVTSINYIGDFNTGCTGENVTHMPALLAKLTELNIHFVKQSDDVNANKEIVLRAFLEGGGGPEQLLSRNNSIYTYSTPEDAKKEYCFNGCIGTMAVLLLSRTLPRPLSTSNFIDSASPSTPASRMGTNTCSSPMLPTHPLTPKTSTPQSFFSASATSLNLISPTPAWPLQTTNQQPSFIAPGQNPTPKPSPTKYAVQEPQPSHPSAFRNLSILMKKMEDLQSPSSPSSDELSTNSPSPSF